MSLYTTKLISSIKSYVPLDIKAISTRFCNEPLYLKVLEYLEPITSIGYYVATETVNLLTGNMVELHIVSSLDPKLNAIDFKMEFIKNYSSISMNLIYAKVLVLNEKEYNQMDVRKIRKDILYKHFKIYNYNIYDVSRTNFVTMAEVLKKKYSNFICHNSIVSKKFAQQDNLYKIYEDDVCLICDTINNKNYYIKAHIVKDTSKPTFMICVNQDLVKDDITYDERWNSGYNNKSKPLLFDWFLCGDGSYMAIKLVYKDNMWEMTFESLPLFGVKIIDECINWRETRNFGTIGDACDYISTKFDISHELYKRFSSVDLTDLKK